MNLSSSNTQTFNTELAILRIIATLMVFIMHAIATMKYICLPDSMSIGREIVLLLNSTSRPAVSIFFMLSGYFLSQRKNGFSLYAIKHFMWIMIIPFVYYSGVYYMRKVYTGELNFNIINFIDMLSKGEIFAYHLWYFFTMIPIYFLWLFITPIKYNNNKQHYLALFLIIFVLIYKFMSTIPFSLAMPLSNLIPSAWLLYPILGAIYIPYIINKNKMKSRWFFIVYILISLYLYKESSVRKDLLYESDLTIGILLQSLSIVGFILRFPYPKVLDKTKKILKIISNSCLSFYGWHVVFILYFTNYEKLQAVDFYHMFFMLIITFLLTCSIVIVEQLFIHKLINPLIGSKLDQFCRDFDKAN